METYKARGLERLGLRSRVGLVRHAVSQGWLVEGGGQDPAAGGVPADDVGPFIREGGPRAAGVADE